MPAIAEEGPVDEMAVIDPVRHEDGGKVDMPPGLRPIGGGGQDGREYLGRVVLRGGPGGNPGPGAGDAIADRGDNGAVGPVAPNGLEARTWSLDMVPLGTMRPVVGCSAETEKALPYGPAKV